MLNQDFLQSLAMMESVAASQKEKQAINAVRGKYVGMYGSDIKYVNMLGRLESVAASDADREAINEVRGRYGLMKLTEGEVAQKVALECISGSQPVMESDTYRDKMRYKMKESRKANSQASWDAFQNGEEFLEPNNADVDKLPETEDPDVQYPTKSGLKGSGLRGKYLSYDVHHDGLHSMDHDPNPRIKDSAAKAKFNKDIEDFEKNAEATLYKPEGGYAEGESDVEAYERLDAENDADSYYIMKEMEPKNIDTMSCVVDKNGNSHLIGNIPENQDKLKQTLYKTDIVDPMDPIPLNAEDVESQDQLEYSETDEDDDINQPLTFDDDETGWEKYESPAAAFESVDVSNVDAESLSSAIVSELYDNFKEASYIGDASNQSGDVILKYDFKGIPREDIKNYLAKYGDRVQLGYSRAQYAPELRKDVIIVKNV